MKRKNSSNTRRNKFTKIFLKDLKKLCKLNQIELNLVHEYCIRQDGVQIGGSFGGSRKQVLTCATKREDWLHILVHESCHLDQYLYDKKIYFGKGDSYDQMCDWLLYNRIRNIDKHINNVQDLELDCEKRAVEKIKRYKLPINIDEYIQKANSYVYFFSYIKYSRKWTSAKKSPYAQEEIWKNMPKTFRKSYRKLPLKYFKLFERYL